MLEDPPHNPSWFEEFKKLNKGGSTADPSQGAQRRRHPRFTTAEAEATLTRKGLLTIFGVGRGNRARAMVDLSEGGGRFLTHERIATGTKVRVRIKVEKYKDVIEAVGKVLWCCQNPRKPTEFLAGVRFTNIDPLQIKKIASMRDWFTSSQYKALCESQIRKNKGDGLIFGK